MVCGNGLQLGNGCVPGRRSSRCGAVPTVISDAQPDLPRRRFLLVMLGGQ